MNIFTISTWILALKKTCTFRRSRPSPSVGFKVVHHATTNLVEDPEDDPVGLFLNEYAVGKNADLFPENSGRLNRAGSKIHLNL